MVSALNLLKKSRYFIREIIVRRCKKTVENLLSILHQFWLLWRHSAKFLNKKVEIWHLVAKFKWLWKFFFLNFCFINQLNYLEFLSLDGYDITVEIRVRIKRYFQLQTFLRDLMTKNSLWFTTFTLFPFTLCWPLV
jgi:hypothetical protein